MDIYLVYSDGKSDKFWQVSQDGKECRITFGKTGSKGQTQIKSFDSSTQAEEEAKKLADAKRKKGYKDVAPANTDDIDKTTSSKPVPPLPGPDPVENKNLDDAEHSLDWLGKSDAELGITSDSDDDYDYDENEDEDDDENEDEDDDDYDEDTDNEYKTEEDVKLKQLLKKYDADSVIEGFAEATESLEDMQYLWSHIDTDDRSQALKYAVYEAFSKYNITKESPQIWEWLMDHGAHEITPKPARRAKEGQLFNNPLANHFWEEYKKDPQPKRVREIWDGYVTEPMKQAMKTLLDRFVNYVEDIRKPEKKRTSHYSFIPVNGVFSKEYIGIQIKTTSSSFALRAYGADWQTLIEYEPNELEGLCSSVASDYLETLFIPEVKKLADDGFFDGLFSATGAFCFLDKDLKLYFRRVFDETGKSRFDESLKDLKANLTAPKKEIEAAFLALVTGLYGEVDEARAYDLILHHLYEANDPNREDSIFQMIIDMSSDDFPRHYYERALFEIKNHSFQRGKSDAEKALKLGYTDAERLIEEAETILETQRSLQKDTSPTALTFDRSAIAKTFDVAFTEKDLYLKTANVVCRARCNGQIYICFLIEGEQGYSEALDFINNLLVKGYAYLSGGWSDGFALNVDFASEPEWISQLENVVFDHGLNYPKSDAHAFFARAVRYPALRTKVATHAELALRRYTWDLDLTDEYNTVPGTFAAAALAFCGPEYFYIVSKYADATDGDHTYIQNVLAPAIAKHYAGYDTCAGVIWDLAQAAGQIDTPLELPEELIWSAEFMEEIMTHSDVDPDSMNDMEYFAMNFMHVYGDSEEALQRLAELADGAVDAEKEIYIRFHNLVLAAAMVWDEDEVEHLQPLKTTPIKKSAKSKSTKLADQEAVISVKEAQTRGYDVSSESYKEPTMIFFSPNCVTAPQTASYIKNQWRIIGTENSKPMDERVCVILLGYGQFTFRFKNWVISSKDLKYECGLIVFDGKNKPVVLFGLFNSLRLGTDIKKQGYKVDRIEFTSDTYLIAPSKERRTDDEWVTAETLLEEEIEKNSVHLGTYLSNWHSYLATRWLETINKDNALIYEMSRVYLAWLAEDRADLPTLGKLAEELETLQPQHKDYWHEKRAVVNSILNA